jgi:hypothetical protein
MSVVGSLHPTHPLLVNNTDDPTPAAATISTSHNTEASTACYAEPSYLSDSDHGGGVAMSAFGGRKANPSEWNLSSENADLGCLFSAPPSFNQPSCLRMINRQTDLMGSHGFALSDEDVVFDVRHIGIYPSLTTNQC